MYNEVLFHYATQIKEMIRCLHLSVESSSTHADYVLHCWKNIGECDTSLVVQWLRLPALNAGSSGSIPGQGTRAHRSQLKKKQQYSLCMLFVDNSVSI